MSLPYLVLVDCDIICSLLSEELNLHTIIFGHELSAPYIPTVVRTGIERVETQCWDSVVMMAPSSIEP